MVYRALRLISFVCVLQMVVTSSAFGLPFNDDMVHDQPKTSEVMRDAPRGSVPVGASRYAANDALRTKNFTPEGVAARGALKNPVPSSASSVETGKRLWAVNCSPCHGEYTGEADPKAPTAARFKRSIDWGLVGVAAGPNLVSQSYIGDSTKSDGHIFSYIHYGGLAVMPRYGYKLSPKEHWDIVNYVRWMQDDFSKVLAKQ